MPVLSAVCYLMWFCVETEMLQSAIFTHSPGVSLICTRVTYTLRKCFDKLIHDISLRCCLEIFTLMNFTLGMTNTNYLWKQIGFQFPETNLTFLRECLPKVYVERNMLFYRALENLTTWKIFLKELKKWTISSTSSLWFWGSSFSAPGAGRLWVIVEGDPETCLCFGIVAQGLGNLTKNFSKLSYDP